ncbi:hypothetical protein GYMLUDRAFT_244611 [Collybiopsis luxurians FD-317 M1]|uniref:Uncharacterized protein n=1 Tax=Collybiopsis luxurians FD-317 M1 TaxID=944289 RepID=A0A0D0B994_9AGAR|nr:hypothetical protein GYMLUDRAFT_244611 [Collybiopsis luxurians FD-317 M1]
MSLRNISYSNEDRNHLQYAGSWKISGTYEATNTGQSGTLSSTNDNSANVTFSEHFFKPTLFNPKKTSIEFPQAATAIYYYGIRRCCGGFYAACIDCNPSASITNDRSTGFQTIDAVNRSDDGKNPPVNTDFIVGAGNNVHNFQVVLWSQTFPSPAVHTVVLTNQFDDRFQNGNSELTVASFVIQIQDDTSPTSSSAGATGTLPSTTEQFPSSSSEGVTGTSPSTPGQSTSSPSSSEAPLKPFLGVLLGGMAVQALLMLAITMWYKRRQRMKTPGGAAGGTQSSVTFIMPFTARESSGSNHVAITETARETAPGRALDADEAGVWPTEQPVNERTPEVNPYETSSDSGTLLPPAYDEISFENV